MSEAFEEILEITTAVVCPNNCLKYCPKEVFIKNYPGDKSQLLSFVDFKRILSTVPKNVIIIFSGFSEPFTNKETIEMLKFANNSGYKVSIYTTLRGASEGDIDELLKIPLNQFTLHLPDGKVLAFPLTNEYLMNVFKVVRGIRDVVLMTMDDYFLSNNRENVVRGLYRKSHRFGRCFSRIKPQFVVLPNGDVQLCCEDFGLWHKLGNLLEEDYPQIRSRLLNSGKFELCKYCSKDQPYHIYALRRIYWMAHDYYNGMTQKALRRVHQSGASGVTEANRSGDS